MTKTPLIGRCGTSARWFSFRFSQLVRNFGACFRQRRPLTSDGYFGFHQWCSPGFLNHQDVLMTYVNYRLRNAILSLFHLIGRNTKAMVRPVDLSPWSFWAIYLSINRTPTGIVIADTEARCRPRRRQLLPRSDNTPRDERKDNPRER